MRVDRGVDVVVADTRLGVVYDVATAMHAPAAARWDTTEFLDVDVDELAGMVCVDPAKHAPNPNFGVVAGLQLSAGSPCLDAGVNLQQPYPAVGPAYDMGAYEHQ